MPVRSWLFTSGGNPERFPNAAKAGADVLLVDLEDAVRPDLKSAARHSVLQLLQSPVHGERHPLLAVRINPPSTRAGLDDIAMLLDAPGSSDYVVIPKIESPAVIQLLASLFQQSDKHCALVGLIESARGIAEVREIAHAHERLVALMFGAADYGSDVRAQPDGLALQLGRVQVASACAEAKILSIDSPCFAVRDAQSLGTELSFAVANGFEAKAAIHPSQISAINEAFTPSADRIAWAKRVVEASEQQGVAVVDGRMVDEAVARQARRLLSQQAQRW